MTNAKPQTVSVEHDAAGEEAGALHELMVEYRQHVLDSIQSAQEMSEGAVLGVGANIDTVVNETRGYIESMKALLDSLSDEDSETNIGHLFQRQSKSVTEFMDGMNQNLRNQENKAQRAVKQSLKILETSNSLKSHGLHRQDPLAQRPH